MKVRWVYDKKKNILMFFAFDPKKDIKRPAEVFEVEKADVIIDSKSGQVIEIHIPVVNDEIRHIIRVLRNKGILLEMDK